MQTKPKSNSTITHAIRERDETGEYAPVITFSVLGVHPTSEGNPTGAATFSFTVANASATVQARAMVHGFIQRISDGGAISRDPETGLPATPETKFNRMKRIAEFYEAGADEWAIRAQVGQRGPDAGLILTAMCRTVAKGSIDEANRLVDALATKRNVDRAAALREWANTDAVLKAIAEIKAERAPKGADDLLAELTAE